MISRDDVIKTLNEAIDEVGDGGIRDSDRMIANMADHLMPLLDVYTQQILDRYISDGTTPRTRQ